MQQTLFLYPADQPRLMNKCLQLETNELHALPCAMENHCKRGKNYSLSGEPLTLDQRCWLGSAVAFAFAVEAVG